MEWTVPLLTAEAAKTARETGDYSLVGLAARAEDPVVLAALRESVVLYAGMEFGRQFIDATPQPMYKYVWRVDPELATVEVVGRCVRLGQTPPPVPPRYDHWAVIQGPEDQLGVREFWDTEIWTTERFRRSNDPHLPLNTKG